MRALTPLCLGLLFACAPNIGDSCNDSSDCSVNGSRICDTAQPSGYCTVRNCDPDTCPGRSICVEWRGIPDRTAIAFCMDRCNGDGACRRQYSCMGVDDPRLLEDGDPLAQIVDLEIRPDARFCVADPALVDE
ncbi:MAG: hypothetical protein AAGE52_34515 [Myxococcota bacterium]